MTVNEVLNLLEQMAEAGYGDREVLGLLMAKIPGSLLRRGGLTAGASAGPLAILGIWRNPARILVIRRGKPLHFGQTKHGFYFASLPEGLPGQVQAVVDHYTGLLTQDNGLRIARTSFGRLRAA